MIAPSEAVTSYGVQSLKSYLFMALSKSAYVYIYTAVGAARALCAVMAHVAIKDFIILLIINY